MKIKSFKITLFLISVLAITYFIFSSHFLWVETKSIATINKEHNVDIFYGEINFNKREISGGKLDKMNGIKCVYLDPNNQENEIQLKKLENKFNGTFIPKSYGLFQVLTKNENAQVVDLTKHHLGNSRMIYYSRQFVLCKNIKNNTSLNNNIIKPYFDLDIIPNLSNLNYNNFELNKPISFKGYFKNKAIQGGKIFVHAINGWSKEIDADENGNFLFTPLWEGQYVIDWVYTDYINGTFESKNYDNIRYRITLTLNVIK